MKKLGSICLAFCLVIVYPATAQKSSILNKVSKSVSTEVLGKPEKAANAKVEPEPSCASDQATIAMDLGGKLQLDYQELTISILSDGRILAQAHGADEYYVAKDGVTTGPFKAGDAAIADFVPKDENQKGDENPVQKFKPYVTKSGEKYLITFAGKKYGPYAIITNFTVSKTKDKFAAMVTETVMMTEDQGKKMEEAMKNAKDDQERMDLAMEYAQQMQQNLATGGGAEGVKSKLISNIPNAGFDPMKVPNPFLNGEIKYDDILMMTWDNKIYDLQGKLLFALKDEARGAKDIFVNSGNTKYAYYASGVLTFSDNTKWTDLFSPHLVRADGKIFIGYMYYSPKHNAIMQHKIAF